MDSAATENSAVSVVVPEAEAAANADLLPIEGPAVEESAAPMEPAPDADQHRGDAASQDGDHGDTERAVNVTPEEMRSIIEVVADTGKYWHDWDFLKGLLSLQLKQVLVEYSEAQMVNREDGQQQNSLSGETCSELFVKLNDALMRFEEGPPFTLQRLCEILLDPKETYTKLPKFALALEKNLLVTSTMTKCTDSYPGAHLPNSEGTGVTENTGAVYVESERLLDRPTAVSNGAEHTGDGDEEMADAEAEGVYVSRDVEMQEKLDQIADVNSDANSGAAVACETVNASEQLSDPQS